MLDAAGAVRLRLIAGMGDLVTIRGVVGAIAARGGGTPAAVVDTLLAMNEAVTSIIEHGCGGAAGSLQVEVENNSEALTVRLRDQAPLIEPTLAPVPDVTLSLDQRPLRGMVVHMVRQLTD